MKVEETHPDVVKDKINFYGSQKRPFLFVVDFELTKGIFVENPMEQRDVLFRCPLGANQTSPLSFKGGEGTLLQAYPESYNLYRSRFDTVMDGLRRGDSFLTNLTVRTPIETPLSLEDIYHLSTSSYCICVPEKFVCFSPERFVYISDGVISTNPMKGTINAEVPNAEEVILAHKKETAEHCTIVDLMRNDLGMVAHNIRVNRFRYIDRIVSHQRDILQVSSEITGRLNDDYLAELGSILFRLLPAGSVSGAPKQSTLDIIRKAEKEPRGYYTGVFGYFDGQDFDSAVMIRYIEQEGDKKYFRSGGGITVFSNPEDEYREVIEKIYLPFV